MRVYDKSCQNCLFSEDRIVSEERVLEILATCIQDRTHFICHKATMEGKDVCCTQFYHKYGDVAQSVNVAKRLNVVKFVPQTDTEKLITFEEMRG